MKIALKKLSDISFICPPLGKAKHKIARSGRFTEIGQGTIIFLAVIFQIVFQFAYASDSAKVVKSPATFRMIVYALGNFPAYSIDAYEDGSVEYVGMLNVKTKGLVKFEVGRDAVQKLTDHFVRAGFFDLDETYKAEEGYADRNQKSVFFELTSSGNRKQVTFFQTGPGEIHTKMSGLFMATQAHIPTVNLRCPYILPLEHRSAGYEICSGKQVFTPAEMVQKLEGVK